MTLVEQPDTFSNTLENKPKQSHISQLKRQLSENANVMNNMQDSPVSRLSRVFDSTSIESLTERHFPINQVNSSVNETKQNTGFDATVDQHPMSFKDIQAKFQYTLPIQNEQTTYRKPVPLQPSKTGPPSLPAKPSPPSLPIKPKILRHSSLPSTSSRRVSVHSVPETLSEEVSVITPELTGSSSTGTSKRQKVIQELLDTEIVYQNDMKVLNEVYCEGASQAGFSKSDIRHLFSNLSDIVEFEDTFVAILQSSCEHDSIGAAFRETMRVIDNIYSEYCKRHEDAVLKLQELETQPEAQKFFADCKEQLEGKTTSWDLGSLLIKPVQRVLKYPLLLRELLSLTPITHKDHADLSTAVQEIEKVANNINDIKKRKDIVERIVGDKKRTDINYVHGINKKFSRRAQKIKQAAGLAVEPTHDVLFEALYTKFEDQQEHLRQLAREVQGWVRHVKIMFENLQQLAYNMEALYGAWGGVRVTSLTGINHFSNMATQLTTNLARQLDNDVNRFVYSRIAEFLKVFDNPLQVIHKRSKKIIDYDRVRDIKSKGEEPDKVLQESADAYVSINAQLLDELPKFFLLTNKYFDILIGGIALVQKRFYKSLQKEWNMLVEQQLGMQAAETYDEIVAIYVSQLDDIDGLASQISILRRVNGDNRNRSNSSASALLRRRSTSSQTKPTRMTDGTIQTQEAASKDFKCIVLYDLESHEHDRLDVKRGTILLIKQDEEYIDPDWWFGTTTDDFRSGWVPINYCKKLD